MIHLQNSPTEIPPGVEQVIQIAAGNPTAVAVVISFAFFTAYRFYKKYDIVFIKKDGKTIIKLIKRN